MHMNATVEAAKRKETEMRSAGFAIGFAIAVAVLLAGQILGEAAPSSDWRSIEPYNQ
jgi:hypothetical protein